MIRFVGSILLIVTLCSSVAADSPFEDAAKMVRVDSEIRRGFLAFQNYNCDMSKYADINIDSHLCILNILNKEKGKNTLNAAFSLGVYYSAWVLMDAKKDSRAYRLSDSSDSAVKSYAKQVDRAADIAFIDYRRLQKNIRATDNNGQQKDLQITDKQLCEFAGVRCNSALPKIKTYRHWLESD